MVLEERKCPNCGSNELLEKDGTFVCMNCRTFFDKPQDVTVTRIERNETEIERIKSAERLEHEKRKLEEKHRKEKEDWKVAIWCLIGLAVLFFIFYGRIIFR